MRIRLNPLRFSLFCWFSHFLLIFKKIIPKTVAICIVIDIIWKLFNCWPMIQFAVYSISPCGNVWQESGWKIGWMSKNNKRLDENHLIFIQFSSIYFHTAATCFHQLLVPIFVTFNHDVSRFLASVKMYRFN